MSISKQLREQINAIKPGVIFGLKDFTNLGNPQVVALELSRLSKSKKIQRLSKGKYFVPKASRFGNLGPSEKEILEKIITENGGYFAGAMALNRIGVTTQIPSTITIRGARSTRLLQIGNLKVKLYKQGNAAANYQTQNITDIIEAIRLIKKTPDGDVQKTITRVKEIIQSFSKKEFDLLLQLSKNERPFVRSILGALMENIGQSQQKLFKASLNPITKYKMGFKEDLFPNMESWGIS